METIEYKGYTIEIDHCDYTGDPREWDNLSTFVFSAKSYSLANELDIDYSEFNSMDEAEAYIRKNFNVLQVFPVSAYIHGGISLSIGSPTCRWDSGYIGFIVIEKKNVRESFNIKRITQKHKDRAIEIAKAELETYNQYLEGQVYAYSVYDDEGEFIDSCSGYYGYDHEESGLIDEAKYVIDNEIKRSY